jgi:hypothetical protein
MSPDDARMVSSWFLTWLARCLKIHYSILSVIFHTQAMDSLSQYVLEFASTVVSACLACGKLDSALQQHKLCAYCPTATYCSRCVFLVRGERGGGCGVGVSRKAQTQMPLSSQEYAGLRGKPPFSSAGLWSRLWYRRVSYRVARCLAVETSVARAVCTLTIRAAVSVQFPNGPAHPLQGVPEGGLEGGPQGDLPQAQDLGRCHFWRNTRAVLRHARLSARQGYPEVRPLGCAIAIQ